MRRKRRSRGIWLPIIGTAGDPNTPQLYPASSIRWTSFTVPPATAAPTVGVVPLLWDVPFEASEFTPGVDNLSMGEFIKNAYFLKRIVGSIFVSWNPGLNAAETNLGPFGMQCTVGLFIARAQDADTAGGFDVPIGGGVTYVESYNPDSVNCIREPWIWRRTWMLGNPFWRDYMLSNYGTVNPPLAGGGMAFHPPTNTLYGSVADGPKIDAKTKRKVSSDDRLWAAVAVRTLAYKNVTYDDNQTVDVGFDLRAFGTPMRDRNRGNF